MFCCLDIQGYRDNKICGPQSSQRLPGYANSWVNRFTGTCFGHDCANTLDVIWTCVGRMVEHSENLGHGMDDALATVLDMYWTCIGHVLDMYWTCIGHVPWTCHGRVLDMFWTCLGYFWTCFSNMFRTCFAYGFSSDMFSRSLGEGFGTCILDSGSPGFMVLSPGVPGEASNLVPSPRLPGDPRPGAVTCPPW